ncbi:MAG: hypothetical protein ACREFP_25225 [Acetobacteraceae bacterium]
MNQRQAIEPQPLQRLRRRFAQWRGAKRGWGRIPPGLWSAAVDSGAKYGVHRTARSLGLDYAQLKRSIGSKPQTVKEAAKTAVAVKSARFVQLRAPAVLGTGECVVEMENARGGKLRVQLKGGDLAGLAALTSGFWGGV